MIVSCVNCYSHKSNLLINPDDIELCKTDDEVYCNSCLVLLKIGYMV